MRKIFNFFFANFTSKIIALSLAIFIWFLSVLFRTNKISLLVPIEFHNAPSELIVTEYNPKEIRVGIEGTGSDLVKLAFKKPKYRLDLTNLKYGKNLYRLSATAVQVASGITVLEIFPELLEIKTDYWAKKTVKIKVPYEHTFQSIYIKNVVVNDEVFLKGPETQITNIDELVTETLSINTYAQPVIQKKLKVIVPASGLFISTPESVLVSVYLEKETTKTFDSLLVRIIYQPKMSVKLKPQFAQITVKGAQSRVNALLPTDIIVRINLQEYKAGTYKIPAEIILPREIHFVKCEPQLFEVELKEKK
jgi:dephospho-CoA kinase